MSAAAGSSTAYSLRGEAMTEQDWMIGTDPTPMLEFVRGKANDRKLRLFAVSCCRLVWHRMVDKCSRRAVEVAERYADGLATPQTLLKWYWAAYEAYELTDDEEDEGARYREVAFAANCATHHDAAFAAMNAAAYVSAAAVTGQDTLSDSREAVCDLLREILGPLPFHPITCDPIWLSWHDGLVLSMAQRMYDSRDFSDMPVLADALEEAGCEDQDILGHCRSGGEHVRGCWVIDALLGKK